MTAQILLVDDNAVQAATRCAILTRAGHSVQVALSGTDALRQLLQGRYGLVITDHIMPLMNGPEFVVALRGTHGEIPVLVLSGLPEAEDEYEGLEVIFRLKPLSPDALISLVADLLHPPLSRTA